MVKPGALLHDAPMPTFNPVCIVDDDRSAREAMASLVQSAGFASRTFGSALDFLRRPPECRPACVVLDVAMPELDGLGLQRRLNESGADVPIIFVTGRADVPTTVRAMKAGALEVLVKPFDPDPFLDAIRLAIQARRHDPATVRARFPGIVGESPPLLRMLRETEIVAATESTVLLCGETGTGKELVARAIHELSPRRGGPFIRVNCAALPSGLLESELLGHEKGAFTGAISQRIGRFELAHKGTIFLDEIGELPLSLQPKLLRVLQEGEFERVGGTKTLTSSFRVIAATHRELPKMVADGSFREDLYYRLSVFPIRLPALRERREDVPLLVRHFSQELSRRSGKPVRHVQTPALEELLRHDWPGNIRELQNVVERAFILGCDPMPGTISQVPAASSERESDRLEDQSRNHILRVLDATNWVIAGPRGAAVRLGMKRSTLNFRMKKLGIARPEAVDE
jgi:DNA-binding NtrC family response regulator